GKEEAEVEPRRTILDPHEKAVLHRVPVDEVGQAFATLRGNPAHVPAHCRRSVETLPAENLRSPGKIGVFAVGKKIFIEEFAFNTHILHHCPAIEDCRAARAKNIFCMLILALVGFFTAAIQMTEVWSELHACAIYHNCKFRLLSISPAHHHS